MVELGPEPRTRHELTGIDSKSAMALYRLRDRTIQALGECLTGVYVHGSAALGGWVPGVSDLDMLIVCEHPVAERALDAIASAVVEATLEATAAGLEMSVIGRDLAERPRKPWPFMLHLATSTVADAKPRIVRDNGDGDADLRMHIAVARTAGITLYGPPAASLFGPVPRIEVLAYLGGELGWGVENAPERYAVLNACRGLVYLETGALVSKIAGGEWALRRWPNLANLIERSLRAQRDATDQAPTLETRQFVADAIQRLRAAVSPECSSLYGTSVASGGPVSCGE